MDIEERLSNLERKIVETTERVDMQYHIGEATNKCIFSLDDTVRTVGAAIVALADKIDAEPAAHAELEIKEEYIEATIESYKHTPGVTLSPEDAVVLMTNQLKLMLENDYNAVLVDNAKHRLVKNINGEAMGEDLTDVRNE